MSLDELTALRDVLDLLVKLPDRLREQIVEWLTPSAAKPNGRDPHLLQAERRPAPDPRPYAGKASRGRLPASAKAAERKLLAAMENNPGSTVAALAKAASAGRSRTGEKLRELSKRGVIEKDPEGRWRLAREGPSPPAGGPEPRPPQPPAS
jgi:hypothetical protein